MDFRNQCSYPIHHRLPWLPDVHFHQNKSALFNTNCFITSLKLVKIYISNIYSTITVYIAVLWPTQLTVSTPWGPGSIPGQSLEFRFAEVSTGQVFLPEFKFLPYQSPFQRFSIFICLSQGRLIQDSLLTASFHDAQLKPKFNNF